MQGQRLAEAADVHIHGPLLHVNVAAPYPVQQLAAAVNPLGMGHEKMQQAELGGAERQIITLAGAALAGSIQSSRIISGRCDAIFWRACPTSSDNATS